MVVFPPSRQRQGHQNTLNAARGSQPKGRPPIINEIEFDIATPSNLLPLFVGLGEIGVLICMFGWTAVLIAAVLWLTRRVLSTVRRMPTLV